MKRGSFIKAISIAVGLSVLLSFASFAGEWQQDTTGWWYSEDDGTYPVNQWQEIDGKQYYFNEKGYMLSDTTTPDGYKVGADGAWVQDGVTQTSGGLTASYGQYSINPLIFEEMNSTIRQLYEKYIGEPVGDKRLKAFSFARDGEDNISFTNQTFDKYIATIYVVPGNKEYNAAYDLNNDGVVDNSDELDALNTNRELYMEMIDVLHDRNLFELDKVPLRIESVGKILSGFGDTCSVEEIGRAVKLMGATDVIPVNRNEQKEITVMRTGITGGLYWENTGRYETINHTYIGFTLHGLSFYANGTNGMINTNTDKWTIKPVK